MNTLLAGSRWIDAINARVGKLTGWLILLTTLISAGNALVRKIFDTSSNALLEVQWYLFAAVFLLVRVTAFCATPMCASTSSPVV